MDFEYSPEKHLPELAALIDPAHSEARMYCLLYLMDEWGIDFPHIGSHYFAWNEVNNLYHKENPDLRDSYTFAREFAKQMNSHYLQKLLEHEAENEGGMGNPEAAENLAEIFRIQHSGMEEAKEEVEQYVHFKRVLVGPEVALA